MSVKKTKDIIGWADQAIMEGRKVPHSLSDPVLREEDGKLYLAFFVFFYSGAEVKAKLIKRPEIWAIFDLENGEMVSRRDCRIQDFSDASMDEKIDISDDFNVEKDLYNKAYQMLDDIRTEVIDGKSLDIVKYESYLQLILSAIPVAYRKFFFDLSGRFDQSIKKTKDVPNEQVYEKEDIKDEINDEKRADNIDLSGIVDKLEELKELFKKRIQYDEYKNKLFDNVHEELTKYKNGMMEKLVDTMSMDIIRMIDGIAKTISLYEGKEPNEENYKKLLNQVRGISEDLQDVLYRQNIEVYNVSSYEVDTRKQKIVKVIPTDDESLDKKIAEVVADGYEKEGRVLRPERVTVYKFNRIN